MQDESNNEVRTVPTGSGFIVYYNGDMHPASTSFIANKIHNKITRQIEAESGMRDHELSAGRLNWKGASKNKMEEKTKAQKKSLRK